jgi:uncharacterized protein
MVYYLYTSEDEDPLVFEFDEEKSRANKGKHGIDFIEAQRLWLDEERWEYPARHRPERRSLVVAELGGTMWTAVITYRGEALRIISVRHSRREEVREYGRRGVR